MKNYKDVKNLYILGDTSEVITNLDDSLVTINTVLSSRYVGGIREMVDEWRGKLITLQVNSSCSVKMLTNIGLSQSSRKAVYYHKELSRLTKSNAPTCFLGQSS